MGSFLILLRGVEFGESSPALMIDVDENDPKPAFGISISPGEEGG
jgi:hypothetical protein